MTWTLEQVSIQSRKDQNYKGQPTRGPVNTLYTPLNAWRDGHHLVCSYWKWHPKLASKSNQRKWSPSPVLFYTHLKLNQPEEWSTLPESDLTINTTHPLNGWIPQVSSPGEWHQLHHRMAKYINGLSPGPVNLPCPLIWTMVSMNKRTLTHYRNKIIHNKTAFYFLKVRLLVKG